MEEELGAEDEVCVLLSAGTRSCVCLWGMMDYTGAMGFSVYVFVFVRVPFIILLCMQEKHGSELIFHNDSWKRSLNKANVSKWESPGINFDTLYAIVQCSGNKWEDYVVLWTGAQVVEYASICLAFCQIKI